MEGRWSEIEQSQLVRVELTKVAEGRCCYCVLGGVKVDNISNGRLEVE